MSKSIYQDKTAKGLVIGLGHPRTGTTSLYALLDTQQFFTVTHEANVRLPYQKGNFYAEYNINRILTYPSAFVGEVAFYYLHYVEQIANYYPYVKFICMKRDKADTINSLKRMFNSFKTNHLTDRRSKHWNEKWITHSEEGVIYRTCFPKYYLPMDDALDKFYDDYYTEVERLKNVMNPGQFRVFDMDKTFNTPEGQTELLEGYLRLLNPLYNVGVQVYKDAGEGTVDGKAV